MSNAATFPTAAVCAMTTAAAAGEPTINDDSMVLMLTKKLR